jgi:hypothetical protein
MALTDRSEAEMTMLMDTVAVRLVGEEVWAQTDAADQYHTKAALLPVMHACVDALEAEPHKAKRGDEVEAWIKATRDRFTPHDKHWNSLDWLLDDYRLHADTATPLSEEVEERE